MFLRWFLASFLALVCLLGLLFPIDPMEGFRERDLFFECELQSNSPDSAALYLDLGNGFSETHKLAPLPEIYPQRVRFLLPKENIRRLRLDPPDDANSFRIASLYIFDDAGLVYKRPTFSDASFSPSIASTNLSEKADTLQATVTPAANDPYVVIPLEQSLRLRGGWHFSHFLQACFHFIPHAATLALLISLVFACRIRSLNQALAVAENHPRRVIAIVAFFAVAASCASVLYLGKSFVSPNFDEELFQTHQNNPTLPNLLHPSSTSMQGSDLGATAWIHKPYSDIQADAFFEHGEFPLWNRYNLQGVPMLGQGQSMLFDLLHWPTILFRGSSVAWDFKYLAQRFLFCFAMGCIVYKLWRQLPYALLIAFASAFLGFFHYRFNHAAYFGFCYMPFILWGWIAFQQSTSSPQRFLATLILLFGNASTLASGTVKEAYMYVLCMNLAGALLFLVPSASNKQLRSLNFRWAVLGSLISVLLTAPIWLTFIDAFFKCAHIYNAPHANQLSIRWLIGLFDDIFLRQTNPTERLVCVSGNWIILLGLVGALANIRQSTQDKPLLALLIAASLPFALVFGIVPAGILESIPLVQGFHHIHDIFSAPLVVLLLIVAGRGLSVIPRHRNRSFAIFLVASLILAILFWGQGKVTSQAAAQLISGYSNFAIVFSALLLLSGSAIILTLSRNSRLSQTILGLSLILCLGRYAQNQWTALDGYVMRPPERVETQPSTYALDRMKEIAGDASPYRVAGTVASLNPGYSGSIGIEGLGGGDSLFPPYHQEFTRCMNIAYKFGWRIFHHPRDIRQTHKALDFLNTRFLVSKPKLPEPEFTLRVNDDQRIYESPTAWPRAFFTNRIHTYGDIAELRTLVESDALTPFAAISTSDSIEIPKSDFPSIASPAFNYTLTANSTAFDIEASAPGLAVLHESFWPGDFEATLDGDPADIIRVNHTFKAIRIPQPGLHRVSFHYRPWTWNASLLIACIGLLALTGIAFLAYRSKEHVS